MAKLPKETPESVITETSLEGDSAPESAITETPLLGELVETEEAPPVNQLKEHSLSLVDQLLNGAGKSGAAHHRLNELRATIQKMPD